MVREGSSPGATQRGGGNGHHVHGPWHLVMVINHAAGIPEWYFFVITNPAAGMVGMVQYFFLLILLRPTNEQPSTI